MLNWYGALDFDHKLAITSVIAIILIIILCAIGEFTQPKAIEESYIPVDAEIISSDIDYDGHDFNGGTSYFVTIVKYEDNYFISYDPEMYRVVNTVSTDTCRVILSVKKYSDGNIVYELVGPNDG